MYECNGLLVLFDRKTYSFPVKNDMNMLHNGWKGSEGIGLAEILEVMYEIGQFAAFVNLIAGRHNTLG